MTPIRFQLTRQRPWRCLYPNGVKGDRGGRWGNPHKVGPDACPSCKAQGRLAVHSQAGAVAAYRADLLAGKRMVPTQKRPEQSHTIEDVRRLLPGKDIGCWCPLDEAMPRRCPAGGRERREPLNHNQFHDHDKEEGSDGATCPQTRRRAARRRPPST
jgi:hypothetical protein